MAPKFYNIAFFIVSLIAVLPFVIMQIMVIISDIRRGMYKKREQKIQKELAETHPKILLPVVKHGHIKDIVGDNVPEPRKKRKIGKPIISNSQYNRDSEKE